MNLNSNSTVAELRNELEIRRTQAQTLQMNTEDADEWSTLNTLRWELEDLDKDIYLSQFIRNNDKLAKLAGVINETTAEAQKLTNTIAEVEQALQVARNKLKSTSPMLAEISGFLDELEATMSVLKA